MQCPHCHLTIPDAAQTAGQTVACPRCASQFVASGGGGEQFDPYYTWLGIPPNEQPANHYRLLGIQLFEANSNVIENAADRQMKHLQSYKIGAKAALSQRLLTEVSAARVPHRCLICRNCPKRAHRLLHWPIRPVPHPLPAAAVFAAYRAAAIPRRCYPLC
jgi:hypothetical protein